MGFQMRGVYNGLALAVAYLDYATKQDVQAWLLEQGGGPVTLNPFLNIVAHTNTGAAFGLFSSFSLGGFNLLAVVSAVLVIALYVFILFYAKLTHALAFAVALILGGGLSNGAERMLYGQVFDFIDVHVGGWHWPAFNVADMSISVGALLAVLIIWRQPASK